jgi:16S rRNA (cytidine1402-2'-O)-methyltransferase
MERRLAGGETVCLVTDAGTPGISDPGLSAVRAALRAGAEVTGIPGPSAVTLAVAVSGLPADRFVFEGFLPRSGVDRVRRMAGLADETRTAVIFCAPGRLAADLADLARTLGSDRPCVVCRELTKLHEEVWRGTLGAAVEHWSEGARGEVTVVIGGADEAEPDQEKALAEVEELVKGGTPLSEAVRRVSGSTGVRRRLLYEESVRRFGS